PDGALYWKAYAQSRMGQSAEALETLSSFYASYPESRWASEARLLEAEIQQAGGNPIQPGSDSDEEIKLAILSGLAHTQSEQAIEMLQKVLTGSYSLKLKDRALFALSQNRSPQAAGIIASIAKGDSHPDLQMKALRYLGLFGGNQNRQLLDEIYTSSSDVEIKRAIIRSWMHSGSKERLNEIASQEDDASLRRAAIRQLGILGARQELSQLYAQEQEQDNRRRILNALAISGAVDELAGLARSESDPDLRRTAVSKLGLVNRKKAGPVLKEIYAQDSDKGVKRAVLTAYFLQRNDQALIEIVRQETDLGLRKTAVQKLSMLGTPAATQFLLELLEK
ncbi:MAG: HEAT repeat domain-containing protein, partial [Acidobacteriota bacterium]